MEQYVQIFAMDDGTVVVQDFSGAFVPMESVFGPAPEVQQLEDAEGTQFYAVVLRRSALSAAQASSATDLAAEAAIDAAGLELEEPQPAAALQPETPVAAGSSHAEASLPQRSQSTQVAAPPAMAPPHSPLVAAPATADSRPGPGVHSTQPSAAPSASATAVVPEDDLADELLALCGISADATPSAGAASTGDSAAPGPASVPHMHMGYVPQGSQPASTFAVPGHLSYAAGQSFAPLAVAPMHASLHGSAYGGYLQAAPAPNFHAYADGERRCRGSRTYRIPAARHLMLLHCLLTQCPR